MKFTLQFNETDFNSYNELEAALHNQLSAATVDYYLGSTHVVLYFKSQPPSTDKDKTLSVRKHNTAAAFNLPKELTELLFDGDSIVKYAMGTWNKLDRPTKLSFELLSY